MQLEHETEWCEQPRSKLRLGTKKLALKMLKNVQHILASIRESMYKCDRKQGVGIYN